MLCIKKIHTPSLSEELGVKLDLLRRLKRIVRTQKNRALFVELKKLAEKVRLQKWVLDHPERRKEIGRISAAKAYKKDPNRLRANYKRYYYSKPGHKRKKADYIRDRRMSNPSARLAMNMRLRVYKALKGTSKSQRTAELVGCSWVALKAHIQGLFQAGMSWDNYGQWHVDHKRPCAAFDLSDPAQQLECFNYSNLQPLWAQDNRIKGSRCL